MMGQGKLREKWAEMALESNKLCTLDNHPHAELCHVVFDLFFFFNYDTTLINIQMKKISRFTFFFYFLIVQIFINVPWSGIIMEKEK